LVGKLLLVLEPIFQIEMSVLFLLIWTTPLTTGTLLTVIFGITMLSRALAYAVNIPSKEMMYIPTSKEIQFKVKGWSDMFGSRALEMAGASVTNALRHSMESLLFFGTAISLGIVFVWIGAARDVAQTNKRLVDNNEILS